MLPSAPSMRARIGESSRESAAALKFSAPRFDSVYCSASSSRGTVSSSAVSLCSTVSWPVRSGRESSSGE